jgi:hypothetical protein
MRLAELEREVQSHVLAGGELPAALAALVAPPAEERWRIYTEAYRLRLIEALTAQYPALAARLGADEFAARVDGFITATPSVFRSVRDYGGELGAYLRACGGSLEDELLAELAEFEWQLAGAFDAADLEASTAADVATVPPEGWAALRFRTVPSLRCTPTSTNAVDAWRATQATPPLPPPPAERIPHADWLIHRRHFEPEFRPLAPGEGVALAALGGGASFGELCERLAAEHGEAAALKAATWLKGWLLEGLLRKV